MLRDLTTTADNDISTERSRVTREGWGARLLGLQDQNGQWGGGAYSPKWTSTTYTLLLLRHLGVDPIESVVESAIQRVAERTRLWGVPYFKYGGELCVASMILALGAYFLPDASILPQPEVLLAGQRPDGGWNCRVESQRSSFHTTISALEGLLEYERAVGGEVHVAAARRRAHEYLLARHLMRRLGTGELIDHRWLLMSFPPRWHYDVLRALDYLRDAREVPDPRAAEAMGVVESKRRRDGTWPLQNRHPGLEHFPMEEGAGKPSRWNTLRALRVMRWYHNERILRLSAVQ